MIFPTHFHSPWLSLSIFKKLSHQGTLPSLLLGNFLRTNVLWDIHQTIKHINTKVPFWRRTHVELESNYGFLLTALTDELLWPSVQSLFLWCGSWSKRSDQTGSNISAKSLITSIAPSIHPFFHPPTHQHSQPSSLLPTFSSFIHPLIHPFIHLSIRLSIPQSIKKCQPHAKHRRTTNKTDKGPALLGYMSSCRE